MAQMWRAGLLGAMATSLRGPTLYYYDCPTQCCYGKGSCNPPDQFATFETFQQCLDATEPDCRFVASILFGLGDQDVRHIENSIYTGIFLDASLIWKTFPAANTDQGRPMRISGLDRANCLAAIPCHEVGYPPTGECRMMDSEPSKTKAPEWPSSDKEIYWDETDENAMWVSCGHFVPQRPSLTLILTYGGYNCTGKFVSPVNTVIPIKTTFRGGDQLPPDVLNKPLPW